MTLQVNEMFYSIQGESTHNGRPCAFVRLSGCNLRCAYCDTRYAHESGVEMAIDDIVARIEAYRCPLVEITGGEPLLQDQTPALVRRFLDNGLEVLVETNGTFDIDSIDSRCVRIVDIKCPSSNESHQNDNRNMGRLTPIDQVKFVIGDRADYDYAKERIRQLPARLPRDHILFSPVAGNMRPDLLARWILDDRLKIRFQIQLHKVLWPDARRGV